MRRRLALLLMLALSLGVLTSCLITTVPSEKTPGEGEEENGESTPEDEEPEDSLWNKGYVGSRGNADYFEKLKTSDDEYIYTDVIELGAAGTKVSFTESQGLKDIPRSISFPFGKRWAASGCSTPTLLTKITKASLCARKRTASLPILTFPLAAASASASATAWAVPSTAIIRR